MNIRSKILLLLIMISVLSVSAIGLSAFILGRNVVEQESFNKLTVVREMKADQIEDYFQFISDQVITFSNDLMIIEAMNAFSLGFETIEAETGVTEADFEQISPRLENYYENEFLKRLRVNLPEDSLAQIQSLRLGRYLPSGSDVQLLQDIYISNNPFDTGEKNNLVDTGHETTYNEAHILYHPIINEFLDSFEYYDIFLVDNQTGNIVYSVFKEVDFGTSLLTGPYKDTNIAEAFIAARDSDESGFVYLADFKPYDPSYHAPAGFISSPIFDGEEKIGVLIFQFPVDRINDIMTNRQLWENVGLGESGETYIVGEDFLIRNQSRFLIEDSENYFRLLEEINFPAETINQIKNLNSTIGLQEVRTEGTVAALSGQTGTDTFPDYRGVQVLSAYKPLEITGLEWVIMSEIDEAEAFEFVSVLGQQTFMVTLGVLAAAVLISLFFSRTLANPLVKLTETAELLSYGAWDTKIEYQERKDEIGTLARNFKVMRDSLKKLVDDLAEFNKNLENLVQERTLDLEKSERRSSSIVESAGEGIIVLDGKSNIILWNTAAETMFGYSAEEAIENPISLIVPEHHIQQHDAAFNRANESGQLSHPGRVHQLSAIRKDGTEFPIELTLSTWQIGEEKFFSGILRDITERLEAQEAIRVSEERVRKLIEIAPDAIITIDSQQKIKLFNQKAETIFGYEADEVLGQSLTVLMPEKSRVLHEDEVGKFGSETTSARPMDSRRDIMGQRKNGETFPAEAGISKLMVEGEYEFTVFFRDISERVAAEEAIRVSEERIRKLIEIAPDAIISIDNEQNITLFNSQAEIIFGYPTAEVLGRPLTMLMPEKSRGLHNAEVDKFSTESSSARPMDSRRDILGQRKNGEIFPAEAGISKLTVEGEHEFTVFFRDISERVAAQEALKLSENKHRTIFQNSPVGVILFSPEGVILDCNDHFITLMGSSREQLIGFNTLENASDSDVRSGLAEALQGKRAIFEGEYTSTTGGRSLILRIIYNPVNPNETPTQVIATLEDITERKEMERQLAYANDRMSQELTFARDIQMSMLPLIFPAFPNRDDIKIFARLYPAREVGGDFYDFYFLDDDHLCFVIGDVSGKGAPGALLMAVSKTLIKSRAADDFLPSSIITHVNNEISQSNDSAMFVTVFIGILNVQNGELDYTNAGHNPPYLQKADGTLIRLDELHGPVIGAMPNLPYKQQSTVLEEGDTILLYTDGVTEALNMQEELYTENRLLKLLQSENRKTPQRLIEDIVIDVKAYEGEAEQADDITVLALQYIGHIREEETGRLDLQIKNEVAGMAIVEEAFEEFALEHNIPDSSRQKVSIVLDELLNNTISYAFRDNKEHLIDLSFVLYGKRLVITIRDDGVPFNPFGIDPPDISLSIEAREVGGLGIFLVRNMMDEFSYQRQVGKNVITLVKVTEE